MARRLVDVFIPAILWVLADLGAEMYRHNGVEGVDLMFHLFAGREDCFYENVEMNKTLHIEYNVIGTGMGDGDVNFQIMDPRNRPVVTEFRKPNSKHVINVPETGHYRVCFDNTYSHFTPKKVAFTFTAISPGESKWEEYQVTYVPEGTYDVQVNEIKQRMGHVLESLNEVQTIQEQYRLIELRDRSTAETNFEKVNYWSTVFLIFSIVIGCMQVFLLKGLFDPHYNVSSYVKKMVRKGS